MTLSDININEINETAALLTTAEETEAVLKILAVKALRLKYATLAAHADFVLTDYAYAHGSETRDHYRSSDGKKVSGILAFDFFSRTNTDEDRGHQIGDRLYLLPSAEWLRIERTGTWSGSAWGAPESWSCGAIATVDGSRDIPLSVVRGAISR